MKKIIALSLAAAVAAGSLAAATGSASADDWKKDNWQSKSWNKSWNNKWDNDWNHHRRHGNGWFAPFLFGSVLGYGVGSYYGGAPYYGSNYDAHVEWCLDHYRTYNPRTNLYFIKRGVPAVCHSPYA